MLGPEDSRQVAAWCKAGRLYEIEEWIRSGRSLVFASRKRPSALKIALFTWFYSLIDLLLRHEASQDDKDEVLSVAILYRRFDVALLAISHGAHFTAYSFADALMSKHKATLVFCIEHGADLVTGSPLAKALHRTRTRAMLGIYTSCVVRRPELRTQLQSQLDAALRQACWDGDQKWMKLLLWAGADPASRGPLAQSIDSADGWESTALLELCSSGDAETLKRLVPTVSALDLGEMMNRAAWRPRRGVIEYLLGIGAPVNDGADGTSKILSQSIEALARDAGDPQYRYRPFEIVAPELRSAVGLLLERGAKWAPTAREIQHLRLQLLKTRSSLVLELCELLLRHQACHLEVVVELVRTSGMQRLMRNHRADLRRLHLDLVVA